MRNEWMRGAAGLALAALLGACGGGDGAGQARTADEIPEEAERGGTVVFAELSDMSKPNPLVMESSLDGDLSDIMYMTLLRGAWRDGRLVYLTAEESPMAMAWHWELTGPDSASLRYYMRSDLKWSDGEPITAEDVIFTYDLLDDERVASSYQEYAEHIDSVTAENDSTVVFHFDRRYPEMRFHSGLGIIPEHVYNGADPSQLRTHPRLVDPDSGSLVVSGAYMVGSWNKGERLTLVPNPHFEPAPNLDRIVIRVIPEATTRLIALQRGEVDFMRPIPFDQVALLRQQDSDVRFETEDKRSYDYISYNPRTVEAFANPRVRRALGLAIDKQGIISALQMDEFAVPAGGPYSPIFADLYDPEQQAPLPHDPERAREILEAEGWVDTDGDGIREKDGRPLAFTLVTNTGNSRRADVSQIVQRQWREVGADVRLQTLETNTFFERLREKEFEAALAGWNVGLSPDLSGLWSPDSPFNFVSYEDPETSRLIEQALSQPTEEAARPFWKAAAARIVQAQPYTWLYYFDQVDGVRERLRGIEVDTYGAYQNSWEWWIPRDRQRGSAPAAD